MSVLSRVAFVGQQRVDLHDVLAMESFTSFDFRAFISAFSSSSNAYILRGFEVVGKTALSLNVNVSDSLVFNPQDGNGSFYAGLAGDADKVVELPADQSNIFVEATFINQSANPITRGLWDPLALTGNDASGTEFSSSVNFEDQIVLQISVNTVGFSDGAIPLLRASTSSSAVTNMIDCRPILWRLGTGGTNPNALHKFGFSNARGEPVPNGTGVGDAVDSPWRSRDATGVLNDKGFRSFKDWADAVMTRLSEISGSALWYADSSSTAPVPGVSLNETFFDTLGHHIQASSSASFRWKTVSGNLCLCGEGTNPGSSPWSDGLVRWKSNYNGLTWHLGNTFQSGTVRSYTDLHFQSPSPVDGGNVYLKLERESPKGSGNPVSWADNSGQPAFVSTKAVTGSAGDFTGIALGDYIRKESEGYARYYQVTKMSDGAITYTIGSNPNLIADNTIICLELTNLVNPAGVITGGASTEPLLYFRSHYSSADLFADSVADTFNYVDANFYWLGRRVGSRFLLKEFGTMQEGEEVVTMESTWSRGRSSGQEMWTIKSPNTVFRPGSGGLKLSTGSGTLLNINKRRRNNTVADPGPTDNSNGVNNYIINDPVGEMSFGDSLWVRLDDTQASFLTNGPVVDTTDALNNTEIATNKWQVIPYTDVPLNIYDNKDVYLVAVCIGSILWFTDGTQLSAFGDYHDNNTEFVNDVKLTLRAQESVLFINHDNLGVIDSDTSNFYYDKTTGLLGAGGWQFSLNTIALATPADADFIPNLGVHTLNLGGAGSTIRIPGNLIVLGNTVAEQVSQLQVEDKITTLGVGNLLNAGYNSGFEIADNTINANTLSSVISTADVTLALASAPGYVNGDIIGVSSGDSVGGIQAGDISGEYTIAASLTSAGSATISGSTLVIRTAVSATSTVSGHVATSTKVYKSEWSVKVSDAAGGLFGITSWAFRVKGNTTTPTITPVSGYGIVATSNSTNMSSTRVPFVNDDNAGPAGVDSTLNYSSNFTWDNSTSTLSVTNLAISGGFNWNYGTVRTANYSIAASDTIVPFDTTAAVADVNAVLPAVSSGNKGKVYIIKDVGGVASQSNKRIAIVPQGADTVDGDSPLYLDEDYASFTLVSNGVNGWAVI